MQQSGAVGRGASCEHRDEGEQNAVDQDGIEGVDGAERYGERVRVVLGAQQVGSDGNAEETAEWAAQHRFRSLIVVTANYHMPRSMRFFHAVMPKMRLIAYPVEPQASWWHLGMLHLLHNEYLKYMAAVVVTTVDPGPPDGKSRGTS